MLTPRRKRKTILQKKRESKKKKKKEINLNPKRIEIIIVIIGISKLYIYLNNDLENLKEGEAANHFWSQAKKNKGQGNGTVSADKPGPTMRSEHHGNIEWHWNGKRRLSAREAARIQSFPDDFTFLPSTSAAYKQIGNAVAPVFGWHIARSVQNFLDENLK